MKFSSALDVVLGGEELFVNPAEKYKGVDVYVAINVDKVATLTCTVGGETKTKEGFIAEAGKIYNLGEVDLGEASENWGFVGAHQGWNTKEMDKLYQIRGTQTYVKRNVTLAKGGFKFYGETSKEVIIEHPEVTGGEQGYLFLKPNTNWTKDNARFAAYFFGNGEEWISMTDSNKDGIYAVKEPSKKYPSVIFCRMNPSAAANNWTNKWNQTGDLTIPTDGKNLFTVPSGAWDNSTTAWSIHEVVEHKDAWTEVTEEITSYWLGVQSANFKLGSWYNYASDRTNEHENNIELTDYKKTYDLYFNKSEDEDWGFFVNIAVVEHGGEAPIKDGVSTIY